MFSTLRHALKTSRIGATRRWFRRDLSSRTASGRSTAALPAMNESNFGSSLSAGECFMAGAVDRPVCGGARRGRVTSRKPARVMSELCPRCDRTALSSSGVHRKSFRRLFPSDRSPRRTRAPHCSVVTSGTVFHSRTIAFASSGQRPMTGRFLSRLLRRRGA